MGFEMNELETMGYLFDYEGKRYIWMYSEDDEDFLNIAAPCVVDHENMPENVFCHLMDKVNGTLKYVKAYKFGGDMWLFYERELLAGEDLQEIISHMIIRLDAARAFLRNELQDTDSGDDSSRVEDDTDEDDKEN